MNMSEWETECPVCGKYMYDDNEGITEIVCDECHSTLEISTQIEWHVDIVVTKESVYDEDTDTWTEG